MERPSTRGVGDTDCTRYTFRMASRRVVATMLAIAAISLQGPSVASAVECATHPDDPGCKAAVSVVTSKYGSCSDPYPLLLSRYTPGPQSATEGTKGITQLNPDFACRLSRFLSKYPSVRIVSAYRSDATQARLWQAALVKYGGASAARKWVAPPGSSMHNKGLAADLANVTEAMRRAASTDGLVFRMAHEGWHIEPLGAVSGDTPVDDGSSPAPSKDITSAIRQAFQNPNAAQSFTSPQSETQCTLPDGLRVPCSAIKNGTAPSGSGGSTPSGGGSAQPSSGGSQNVSVQTQPSVCSPLFYCSGDDLYYRTSACENRLQQSCERGCSNAACNPAPISDRLDTALSTAKAASPTSSVSAFERIGALANPNTDAPAQQQVQTPIIIVSAEDAIRLAGSQQQLATQQSGLAQSPATPVAPSTFISGDLSSGAGTLAVQPQSALMRTLEEMKNTVLGALQYLRPFGLRAGLSGGGAEHAE